MNIADAALPPRTSLGETAPLVIISGTCMNSGKTYAATELIKQATRNGLRVAAAKLSGIRINRVKLTVYSLGAALAALGGVIVTSRLDSAQPNAGISYELDAIAAVVVGGTSLMGGRGSVTGTLIGTLFIGILSNVLQLNHVDYYVGLGLEGPIILLAVLLQPGRKSR